MFIITYILHFPSIDFKLLGTLTKFFFPLQFFKQYGPTHASNLQVLYHYLPYFHPTLKYITHSILKIESQELLPYWYHYLNLLLLFSLVPFTGLTSEESLPGLQGHSNLTIKPSTTSLSYLVILIYIVFSSFSFSFLFTMQFWDCINLTMITFFKKHKLLLSWTLQVPYCPRRWVKCI